MIPDFFFFFFSLAYEASIRHLQLHDARVHMPHCRSSPRCEPSACQVVGLGSHSTEGLTLCARSTATSELEQAVSVDTQGPCRPKA